MPGRIGALSLVAASSFLAAAANAAHHQWDFKEIFSNADGSVQFIEMIGGGNNEQLLNGWTITQGANTFTFVGNLPETSTLDRHVLVATSNFAALSGAVAPDYILPGAFLATGGGTLVYAGGADTWSYGSVPTDGVNALQRDGSSATNSPTNFANQAGSVDLSTAAIPSIEAWGIVLLIGARRLASRGLLRRSTA
jgi:serralysin